MLNSDAQRFSTERNEKWTEDTSNPNTGRVGYPAEGPGAALGMDYVIQTAIDKLNEDLDEPLNAAVLDRDHMSKKYLVKKFHFTATAICFGDAKWVH